ncbi:hypothetical protein FB451DRAFT_1306115 [Mycena latifolia]|nr:hypothetical protein FB451DRAFT_1306115 [Mycena latifolia]
MPKPAAEVCVQRPSSKPKLFSNHKRSLLLFFLVFSQPNISEAAGYRRRSQYSDWLSQNLFITTYSDPAFLALTRVQL